MRFLTKIWGVPELVSLEKSYETRLWWCKCAGDRKIEPRTSLSPPQSTHPTIAFWGVLQKLLNRKYPIFLSLEAIFEPFPVSETILTFTIRSGSIFCIGYAPNIYSWVSKKNCATKWNKNVIYRGYFDIKYPPHLCEWSLYSESIARVGMTWNLVYPG